MRFKVISLIASFFMILGIMCSCDVGLKNKDVTSKEADTANFNFTLNTDGTYTLASVKEGAEFSSILYLPSQYEGVAVTAVGENCFANINAFNKVSIPASYKKIGVKAFDTCENLNRVTMYGVEEIASNAFANCTSLWNVDFAPTTKTIGMFAFSKSKVSSVDLSKTVVEEIGSYAFYKCTVLADVSIPAATTTVGEFAFADCGTIRYVVSEANSNYTVADGELVAKA